MEALLPKDEDERRREEKAVRERAAELANANAELRRSEERFRALAEASFEGILFHENGRIVDCNEQFGAILGFTREELLGRNVVEFVPAEERDLALRGARERCETVFDIHARRKDGSLRVVEVHGRPILGEHSLRVAALRDITERKKVEEALARSREELECLVQDRTAQLVEANANLQSFAHTAAHDLRAPLRAINSFAGLTLSRCGVQLDDLGRSMLQRMVDSAKQMDRLLSELLEYSRISQADLQLERVELDGAVREALGMLEEEIRTRQASVSAPAALPGVVGHRATLVMVISNLAGNGLKFVPAGVQPRLRIWAEIRPPEWEAPVPACERGGPESKVVRLWVEDNGIGIAPEDQGKIFGAFQRLHAKQQYPGTGLGLAIVRKAADRMGGRAGVESEPGKGSRFWLELKAAE